MPPRGCGGVTLHAGLRPQRALPRPKRHGGVYLTAALLAAAREEYISAGGSKKPLNAFVPGQPAPHFWGRNLAELFLRLHGERSLWPRPRRFQRPFAETSASLPKSAPSPPLRKNCLYLPWAAQSLCPGAPLPVKNAALRRSTKRSITAPALPFQSGPRAGGSAVFRLFFRLPAFALARPGRAGEMLGLHLRRHTEL